MATANAWDYEEKRFWKKSDSPSTTTDGYEKLVENLTKITNSASGDVKQLIPAELIDFFSLEKFEAAFTISDKIDVANNIFTGAFTDETALWSQLTSSNNDTLKRYYERIRAIPEVQAGDNMLISHLATTAEQVVKYFTWSSILYTCMYAGSVSADKPPIHDKITLPARNASITLNTLPSGEDSDELRAIQYANGGTGSVFTATSIQPYNVSKIIDAIYEINDNMNIRNETYNTLVTQNISLNNTFENQDLIIGEKETMFNKHRSYVLTMMNKNTRINKLYNKKRFWFWVFLVVFLFYVFGMVSLLYTGSSNLLGMNAQLVGNVIVVLNTLIVVAILLYHVLHYFFKNKFFF
uniref:Uncharacterized protein n=1 Tax=viral metagenome TaxID=1070528 RepID=A0A6C0BRA9_9ZZZZ